MSSGRGKTVWIASYPKSGNTWLRAVYTALCTGAEPDINSLDGGDLAADRLAFDVALGIRSSDLSLGEIDALRPRAEETAQAALNRDRWRKIHDALLPGPSGELIVSVEATRCALYMIRDPRDVAVSLASHGDWDLKKAARCLASDATSGSTEREVGEQLRQRVGTWSSHVRSWADQDYFPVHVIRYEDCVADPVATFYGAFRFGGLDVSEEDVSRAVSACSFDRLRDQETRYGFREVESLTNPFFRRGPAGSWKKELPSDLATQILKQHVGLMARFGYGD